MFLIVYIKHYASSMSDANVNKYTKQVSVECSKNYINQEPWALKETTDHFWVGYIQLAAFNQWFLCSKQANIPGNYSSELFKSSGSITWDYFSKAAQPRWTRNPKQRVRIKSGGLEIWSFRLLLWNQGKEFPSGLPDTSRLCFPKWVKPSRLA